MKKNPERDEAIYQMWRSGKKYKAVAIEFEITESGVSQAIKRYRKQHNLPNGRKYKNGGHYDV
jgi:Mor family transcriptional regulator